MHYVKTLKQFNESQMKEDLNEGLRDNLKKMTVGAALLASLASCQKQETPTPTKNWGKDTTNVITPKDTPKDTTKTIEGTWYPVCNQNPDDQHFIFKGNNFDWVWSKSSGNGLVIKYTFTQNSDGSLNFKPLNPSDNFDIRATYKDGILIMNGTECVKLK
jgi:hypothetical protein